MLFSILSAGKQAVSLYLLSNLIFMFVWYANCIKSIYTVPPIIERYFDDHFTINAA